MFDFKDTDVVKKLIFRWKGKDMEKYFEDKAKEFLVRLIKETKTK